MQRIKQLIDFGDYQLINILVNAIVFFGTSIFPFVIGAIFAKDKMYTKIHRILSILKYKNTLSIIGITLLIIFHGFVESMFVAPFTAIAFICLFNVIEKKIFITRTLNFLANHSTNIWLTHMFFYISLFPELTFAPTYPILIYGWLIILCLLSSYIINVMYKPLSSYIDRNLIFKRNKNVAA